MAYIDKDVRELFRQRGISVTVEDGAFVIEKMPLPRTEDEKRLLSIQDWDTTVRRFNTQEELLDYWKQMQDTDAQKTRARVITEARHVMLMEHPLSFGVTGLEPAPIHVLKEIIEKRPMLMVKPELEDLNQEIAEMERYRGKKLAELEYYLDVRFPNRHGEGFTRQGEVEELRQKKMLPLNEKIQDVEKAVPFLKEIRDAYDQRLKELQAHATPERKAQLLKTMQEAVSEAEKHHKQLTKVKLPAITIKDKDLQMIAEHVRACYDAYTNYSNAEREFRLFFEQPWPSYYLPSVREFLFKLPRDLQMTLERMVMQLAKPGVK